MYRASRKSGKALNSPWGGFSQRIKARKKLKKKRKMILNFLHSRVIIIFLILFSFASPGASQNGHPSIAIPHIYRPQK
jgi:hypothetical protein